MRDLPSSWLLALPLALGLRRFLILSFLHPSHILAPHSHLHFSFAFIPNDISFSFRHSPNATPATPQPRARHLTKKVLLRQLLHCCTFSHNRLIEVKHKAKMAYPTLPPNLLSTPNTYSDSVSPTDPEPITPELVSREPEKPAQKAAKTAMNNTSTASKPSESKGETLPCKWTGCSHISDSPDELYDHLCTVHVGRKSTNNLCLTCGWENCGTKCVKRDHITSHLRGKFQNDL